MSSKLFLCVACGAILVTACGDDGGSGGSGGQPSNGGNGTGGETAGAPEGGSTFDGGAPANGGNGTGGTAGSGGAGEGGANGTTTISTSACPGDTCDLTVTGFGLAPFEGKTFYWGVQLQGQQGFVGEGSAVIQGGAFSASSPGVLEKGATYFVNYFIDVNANAECDATPTDAVFRISLPVINANYHLDVTDDETYLGNLGCSGHP